MTSPNTFAKTAAGGRRLTPAAAGYVVQLLRNFGVRGAAAAVAQQVRSEYCLLGLRCDLGQLPPVPAARIAVQMREVKDSDYPGFEQERERVSGSELSAVLFRIRTLKAGVKSLYVAELDGSPVYCQWLVRAAQQPALDALSPGGYLPLGSGEVLLENAYTFMQFRGCGAMATGMAQLLHIARAEGSTAAFTYVTADNTASLKGCARVGFVANHRRLSKIRLGRRTSIREPLDEAARTAWFKATGQALAQEPAQGS
jgi:hypothetical protein